MSKTLLALGAHYDDCVFGIPGILLQAVRKHYRVVIASLIGDYSNWPPIGNRQQLLLEKTVEISRDYGVEMRYLNFRSHLFDVTTETKQAVASLVADVQPETAFLLWPHDHHDDHVMASRLSEIALRFAASLLDKKPVASVQKLYYYDNGPRHTIGFEPDTFVDISDDWPRAAEWLGRFMAVVRDAPYDPKKRDSSVETKLALAAYRGQTCGARYAEAVRTANVAPRDIL